MAIGQALYISDLTLGVWSRNQRSRALAVEQVSVSHGAFGRHPPKKAYLLMEQMAWEVVETIYNDG